MVGTKAVSCDKKFFCSCYFRFRILCYCPSCPTFNGYLPRRYAIETFLSANMLFDYSIVSGIKMEWSNDGEILAVGGFVRQPNLECNNSILFYTKEGGLRFSMPLPTQVRL